MIKVVQAAADRAGAGVVALHEGGYSEMYVPFCGLAVMEELSGQRTCERPHPPRARSAGGHGDRAALAPGRTRSAGGRFF